MKINLDLVEERKSPIISSKLNRDRNYWYTTKETTSTDYTYSVVEVCSQGNVGLLLGINPRMSNCVDYETEVKNFFAQQKEDTGLRHRDAYKDALEPTRRNAIIDMLDKGNGNLNKLITVDLFAKRTHNSRDLINEIKKEKKKENLNSVIGKDNEKALEEAINESNIIIIAWGDALDVLKEVPCYCDKLYKQLTPKLGCVYWYGCTKNGSPRHVAYRGNLKLKNINENELKNALGL